MVIMPILYTEHACNVMMLLLYNALNLAIMIKISIWITIRDFITLFGQMDSFTAHRCGFQQYILQSVNKDMLSMR